MSDATRIKELTGTVELLKARLSNALEEAADLRDEAERRADEAESFRRALAEVTAERDRLKDELAEARRRIRQLKDEIADNEAVMDEVACESAYVADLDWEEVEP